MFLVKKDFFLKKAKLCEVFTVHVTKSFILVGCARDHQHSLFKQPLLLTFILIIMDFVKKKNQTCR